jgi:soluble lytic murein transglycosylase
MVRTARMLAFALVVTALGSAGIVYLRWLFREQRYNSIIEQMSGKYGVDKFLIKAVIRRESKFDPLSYGSHGEIGLMQVMPGTGAAWARAVGRKDFGKDSLWLPSANIEVGTWYLARALHHWQNMNDPVPFALAEYNAGPGNVQRWISQGNATNAQQFADAITYPGVRHYIETITDYYQAYQAAGNL